jgi:hypothetical protein
MPTLPSGRYQLKSLHEEIALFDRKLAHLHKYESFATEAERNASADKLAVKRNLLVKKAQQMIDEGIEFNELERPQSLRPDVEKAQTAENALEPAPDSPNIETSGAAIEPDSQLSPYAGTALDVRQEVESYRKSKVKRKAS